MPQPARHPESPGSLPRPELNPLMNPLLGENLGRWAEVYITTPAEKREDAIRELLRELEAKPVLSLAKPQVPAERTEPPPVAAPPGAQAPFSAFRTRTALIVGTMLVVFTLGYIATRGRGRNPSAQTPTVSHSLPPITTEVTSSSDAMKQPGSLPPTPAISNSQGSIDGARELAIGRDYLNGTNGKPRDSAEAVTWLWKAVARKNTAATLLLADRYAAGDGVGKNCEQARVLLDAAVRKRVPGAEDRLRHLAALDCP